MDFTIECNQRSGSWCHVVVEVVVVVIMVDCYDKGRSGFTRLLRVNPISQCHTSSLIWGRSNIRIIVTNNQATQMNPYL